MILLIIITSVTLKTKKRLSFSHEEHHAAKPQSKSRSITEAQRTRRRAKSLGLKVFLCDLCAFVRKIYEHPHPKGDVNNLVPTINGVVL